MMKRYIFCFLTGCCCLFGSCSKWIDVKPTDRLSEDLLFADRDGFLKALNGVYVEMAHQSLYGQHMTAGALDVLGQYYFMTGTLHTYLPIVTFDYTQDRSMSTFDNVWRKAYELIANCNIILDHCGEEPSEMLPNPYYGIIKGEALALRAMLHFDMLRLFGPVWEHMDETSVHLPYAAKSGIEIAPMLPAEAVLDRIIDDLTLALSLLEGTDPIRTEGVRNSNNPSGSNEFHYRQYRLNFYATKALLARAHLWKADKPAALQYAKELLAEIETSERTVFPYVTFADATHAVQPDRVFSTEVMFAVYKINRVDMYNALFAAELHVNSKLSFTAANTNESRVNALYDDANDYRRRIWQNVTSGTTTTLTNVKYQDIVDAPGRFMIPLIRLSEILLIAAECSEDLQEGIAYLNSVRYSRNCIDLAPASPAALQTAIGNEFRKEMIGEGQQFFYYKRLGATAVPNHSHLTNTKTMVINNYVVPLPESEISQRGNSNN